MDRIFEDEIDTEDAECDDNILDDMKDDEDLAVEEAATLEDKMLFDECKVLEEAIDENSDRDEVDGGISVGMVGIAGRTLQFGGIGFGATLV